MKLFDDNEWNCIWRSFQRGAEAYLLGLMLSECLWLFCGSGFRKWMALFSPETAAHIRTQWTLPSDYVVVITATIQNLACFIFFNVDHFKVFTESILILLLFYLLLFQPWDKWDPGSSTWDQTHTSCIGRWSPPESWGS